MKTFDQAAQIHFNFTDEEMKDIEGALEWQSIGGEELRIFWDQCAHEHQKELHALKNELTSEQLKRQVAERRLKDVIECLDELEDEDDLRTYPIIKKARQLIAGVKA